MTTAPRRIPVYCVLPARTLMLDVAGPMEALRGTNQLQQDVAFDVRYIGPLPELTSSIGLRITGIEPLPDTIEPDAMVIVSGHAEHPLSAGNPIDPPGAGSDQIVEWLRHIVQPGIRLVCICAGALLAARAGLLADVTCTTLSPTARTWLNSSQPPECSRTASMSRTANATPAQASPPAST